MFGTSNKADFAALADRLDQWCSRSPGREFVERERVGVEQLFSGLFGYYLLQVGWTRAFVDNIRNSRICYHVALEEQFPGLGAGNSVIAQGGLLPIASDSVDVVFLPHTLDFAANPHQILREAERVLIPEGRVVILGFNPWSAGGAGRLLRHGGGRLPWCGNFIGAKRVADWLALLGFDTERQLPISFLPPMRASYLHRLRHVEVLGERWLPMLASAYGIRAVKRVSTLTPLQPRWNARSRVLAGQAVEPTTRGGIGV